MTYTCPSVVSSCICTRVLRPGISANTERNQSLLQGKFECEFVAPKGGLHPGTSTALAFEQQDNKIRNCEVDQTIGSCDEDAVSLCKFHPVTAF